MESARCCASRDTPDAATFALSRAVTSAVLNVVAMFWAIWVSCPILPVTMVVMLPRTSWAWLAFPTALTSCGKVVTLMPTAWATPISSPWAALE
jgi:hypothetical protein